MLVGIAFLQKFEKGCTKFKSFTKNNQMTSNQTRDSQDSFISTTSMTAGRILDTSQGHSSRHQRQMARTGHPPRAHPRGHSPCNQLHPIPETADSVNRISCVENYSRTGRKTGFLSRAKQNSVLNEILKTDDYRRAVRRINDGQSTQENIWIARDRLNKNRNLKMDVWENGHRISSMVEARGVHVTIDAKEDKIKGFPHIITMYPTS